MSMVVPVLHDLLRRRSLEQVHLLLLFLLLLLQLAPDLLHGLGVVPGPVGGARAARRRRTTPTNI